MKLPLLLSTLLLLSSNVLAANKGCEELKAEIASALNARHLAGYVLEIVPADKTAEGKLVGRCERGSKKIFYRKK